MELAAVEAPMALMDRHSEIAFSSAQILLSHSWRKILVIF